MLSTLFPLPSRKDPRSELVDLASCQHGTGLSIPPAVPLDIGFSDEVEMRGERRDE